MPAKFPKTPLIALLAVVLLLVGVWWGGHPSDLPGFLRSSLTSTNTQTEALDEAVSTVLHDYYRPLSSSQVVNTSIAGLVAGLHDEFSNYLPPSEFEHFDTLTSGQFTGVGMEVAGDRRGLLVQEVFDGSPAEHAGIATGDLIVAANGHSLAGLSADAATALIKGPVGTSVELTVRQGAEERTLRVEREQVSPVTASRMVYVHGIPLALVKLDSFSDGAHAQVREAVDRLLAQGARGIIFDLRGNPGGLVEEAQLIASIFLPSGEVVVTTRGRTQPTQTLYALGGDISTKIPMAVLVDEGTASAAEIVTGALQDHHRATVIGTRTFGKGVFQEVQPLANGGALDITVGEYFTPNGRNLGGGGIRRGAGIQPDMRITAQPTLSSDPALSAAERELSQKLQ